MLHEQHRVPESKKPTSRKKPIVCSLIFLLAASSAGIVRGQGRFDDLLKRLPASTNALVVIDIKAVLNSPLAVKESWKDKHRTNYMNLPMILPPESDRLVLASQMNPNREFEQIWEAAVISLSETLSIQSIARAEGGYVDTINGLQAAWTPCDAYFVKLDAKTLGVMHPAHRQAVSRWADYSLKNSSINISPYLKQAASMVDGQSQIVMALDLKDALQPQKLQAALRESELARGDIAKQRKWAKIIQAIRGVTLKVHIDQSAHGTLQVDFAENTAPLGNDAKAMILGTLDKYEVGIVEMQQWNVKREDYSVVLDGDLSISGMRKIFSLLELPTSKFSTLKDQKTGSPNDRTDVVQVSKRYFNSVTTLVDDLRKEMRTNQDARRGLSSVFMKRYGRKIDRLPILYVDEELLAFGAKVSETLRTAATARNKASVRTGVRKSQVYGDYQYNYDGYGYGYYSSRTATQVRSQMRLKENAKALKVRFDSFEEIENSVADIRKKMTEKYSVEF